MAEHVGGAFWHCLGRRIGRQKNRKIKSVVALDGLQMTNKNATTNQKQARST
jgi:hypothetical protein